MLLLLGWLCFWVNFRGLQVQKICWVFVFLHYFCSFMLSLELLRKTFSIFLANSVSTEGPSSSYTDKSSSTWPNIYRLILIGVAVGSVASTPTSVIILIILMQEPTSLLVWRELVSLETMYLVILGGVSATPTPFCSWKGSMCCTSGSISLSTGAKRTPYPPGHKVRCLEAIVSLRFYLCNVASRP